MATYSELYDLRSNASFRNKVAMAAAIKAQNLVDGATPSNAELVWANETLVNPDARAEELVNYVLSANDSLSTSAILAATDSAIQTNVNAAADKLLTIT